MKKAVTLAVLIAAAFGTTAAVAAEGPWMVRVRALDMLVDNSNDPAAGIEVEDKVFPEVDISYFITKNIATELILTYPQEHDVKMNGTKIGSAKHLPPTLMLQYHFMPDAQFRPYVGLGINYTIFSDVNLLGGAADLEDNSFGWAAQVGADYKLADKWFLNVDAKYVKIETDVKLTATGAKVTTLGINPWLLSVGVGYRF